MQVEGRLVGVIAMFARYPLTDAITNALNGVAHEIALGSKEIGWWRIPVRHRLTLYPACSRPASARCAPRAEAADGS